MWDLFIHPANLFFSVSLVLMLLMGICECLLLIVGASSQGFLDQFIPDSLFDAQHPDLNIQADHNIGIQFLEWLYLGRIPVLIWFIIFLTTYALFGFFVQAIFFYFTEHYFPIWIIAPAILILCMPLVRAISAIIAKIIPKDETTAIHSDQLIGLTATIIMGDARLNYPAQAKVKDQFGLTHYVMVEPETDILFKQGQSVILTQKTKIGFQAIST